MAKETEIGNLAINLKLKLEGIEKGIETAKKKLQEIEKQNEQIQNSNKGLDISFVAMSAGIIASMHKVVSVVKEATEEYKSYTQAMSSLSDVADYTGNSLDDMSELMNKYGTYMTKADLASTIKNFSLMGMSIEQTDQMLQSLINSAIKNRNANYDVSTAVKVASDGYKQGLSTLSDSAGVTENLSVMLDKYAEKLGKTASKLTEEEQNQAYVNRTMEAAAPFAGAMSEYLDTLAGKQGEYNQALRETQVAYAEALEPTLVKFEELKTKMISGLGEWISTNEEATAGLTVFITTLGGLSLVVVAGKKVLDLYTKSVLSAKAAHEGLGAVIKANPFGMIVTGATLAVAAISGIVTALDTQKQKTEELEEAGKKHNQVLQATADLNNNSVVKSIENVRDSLQEYINLKKEFDDNEAVLNTMDYMMNNGRVKSDDLEKWREEYERIQDENVTLAFAVTEANNTIKQQIGLARDDALTMNDVENYLKAYNKRLEERNARQKARSILDTETVKMQQKEAAQLKANANQMQAYLNIVKKGNTSTTEYQTAVKKITEAYGEASTAAGIDAEIAQKCINIDQARADEAWNASQTAIQGNIQVAQRLIELAEAATNDKDKQAELAQTIGLEYGQIIPTLNSVLTILKLIGGYTPDTTPNVTPTTVTTPKSSSGGSYSNKRLDNYKKEIEHKKALDQISLKQEISMYETALRKYTKTTDEKMELREKIYALNKELAQKEKEVLDEQTEDYEAYIQQQINARGAEYDAAERTRDYDKIISMHRNYLNQIMKDERLSLDERKSIYREELQTIRDYEQQKRDLRVESIDNTVTQLTNAITKQLEEQQEKDTEYINKQIEEVERLKKIKIDAINAEYDAKIEAIEKELQALDKAEQQKSRDEEDAEYERKRLRLEQLVAFEHDAVTKANYQKELDKLVADYQKTLDKRALEDKKEALNEQKDLLKEEQDNKTQAIEDEVEKQKEVFNKQLEDLEKYYSEQVDMAQQTAEKMLINAEQNQENILNLLKSYGNAYEITGQSLGEKLAQGINEGIANKIENVIQNIQNTIDRGIENKIAEWNRELYKYEAGTNKPQMASQTINITQQNYIEQNPELPSETYRKLRNVSENLAAEIAGL